MPNAMPELFAYWVTLHALLSSADFFSKLTSLKYSFRNIIRVSISLDPDQARRFVWLDLGPNCLQSLSADDTSRQRVKGTVNQSCIYNENYFRISLPIHISCWYSKDPFQLDGF